jgi:hypothetical protein
MKRFCFAEEWCGVSYHGRDRGTLMCTVKRAKNIRCSHGWVGV